MMYLSFFLLASACFCLCLSQAKHFRHFSGTVLGEQLKLILRVIGYGALLISLWVAYLGNGSIGLVYWCGLFSLVTIPMIFFLPYLRGDKT
ncbi:MAG: DUF3325 domain-containing protein [Pseudomonadota bacterium]